jgi:thioredoxin reductase
VSRTVTEALAEARARGVAPLDAQLMLGRLLDRSRTRLIAHDDLALGQAAARWADWLERCVVTDERGFIKTGSDLTRDELDAAGWPLARAPHTLETSLPGIFAVGDVRSGSMKRVASAVGEGAAAVAMVHKTLRE